MLTVYPTSAEDDSPGVSETESSDTEQGGGGPGSDDAGSSGGDARTDQLITFQSLFPSMEAVYGAKVLLLHHQHFIVSFAYWPKFGCKTQKIPIRV